jgi:Flp pilus assembly protein TadG
MTSRRAAADRGSMALELTIIAPFLFLLLTLVLAYGRYASVTGLTESAARDSARAATQERSLADAEATVARITTDTLKAAPPSCTSTATGRIVGRSFLPGEYVTVVVRCEIDYSDLGLPGVGGKHTITRRFTSPLDPFRGVDP